MPHVENLNLIKSLKHDIEQDKLTIQNLKSQLESKTTEFEQLQNNSKEQESDLKKQLELKDQELKNTKDEFAKQQKQLELKDQEIKKIKDEFAKQQKQLESKDQEMKKLKDDCSKQQKQLTSKDQELKKIKDECSKQQKQIESKDQELVKFKDLNSKQQKQLATKDQELKKIQTECSKQQKLLDSKDQELKKFKEQKQSDSKFQGLKRIQTEYQTHQKQQNQQIEYQTQQKQQKQQDSNNQELTKIKEIDSNDQNQSDSKFQGLKRNKDSNSKDQKQSTNDIKILDEQTIHDLETIEEISYNNNGKVLKVAQKQFYVLKILNIKNGDFEILKSFMNEYEIMNILDHPNIIKTHGIFLGSQNKPPSILIEFCPTSLDKKIQNKIYTNVDIAFMIYQIVEGMKYVHFKHIIHRDLKPSNILIASDGLIRIADFGISKLMTPGEQNTTGVGTQRFMAPEIIKEEEYNEKVDVYSFGVLAFYILSGGQMPDIKMVDVIQGKKAEIPSNFTEFAKKLINSCWNLDPKDRPSFDSICQQLNTNCHLLVNISNFEIKELHSLIDKHKKQIPAYGNKPKFGLINRHSTIL